MHNPGHPARLGWGAGTNHKKKKWAAALSILVPLVLDTDDTECNVDKFEELASFCKNAAAVRRPLLA